MNFLSNPYTIPQQTNKNEYSTKYELFNWTKIEYIFTHSMKLGIRKFVLFWLDKTILWIYTDWRNVTVQSSLTRLALTFPPAVGQVYSSTLYQNDFGLIWNCTWYNLENKKSVRFGTLFHLSGRRDSNSRPLAWKANALSTELLPLLYFLFLWSGKCGESRIRTYEGVRQQIYSLPQLAALVSPRIFHWKFFRDKTSNFGVSLITLRT